MAPENEDLNEQVEVIVQDSDVVTVPIDATLSNSGEAADAKAVGDALALKADASQVTGITVNGQSADLQGHIIVDATQIEMSSTDNTKVQAAVAAAAARTGADIPLNAGAGAVSIEQAIAGATARDASVTANVLNLPGEITDNSYAVQAVKMGSAEALPVLDPAAVKSVNNVLPATNGNVNITTVDVARQLQTNKAQLSEGTFLRRTAGGTANIGDGDAWLGVVRGNMVHTGYTAENFAVTVTSSEEEPITAEVTNKAAFRTEAEEGGTFDFNYTTAWDENPASWGITVTGTPTDGDTITVVWVEEVRGTITPATPGGFTATGWNLYNHTAGYARVLKYSGSDSTMFMIRGTYTGLQFSATPDGTRTTITPDANGGFDIAADGYIFVTGGNVTDTAIWMPWSDWDSGYEGSFQTYSESTVDLNDALTTCFPNGLCAVETVQDEINITIGQAIQRIERMAYSAENLAAVIAAGRAYEYDEDYIYAALDEADWVISDFADEQVDVECDGAFTANDHGLEWFEGTGVACWAQLMYGENLVDKLRTDVVTKSADIVDALNSTATDKALSANQGKVLSGLIATYGLTSGTVASIESQLVTLGASMSDNEFKNIRFYVSTASGLFAKTTYCGTLKRGASGLYVAEVQGTETPSQLIQGVYKNSAWTWSNLYTQVGNLLQYEFTCPKNGKLEFTCSDTTTAWLIAASRSTTSNYAGCWLVTCAATSGMAVQLASPGSQVAMAFDSTTNKMTLTNSSSSYTVNVSAVRIFGTGTLTATAA